MSLDVIVATYNNPDIEQRCIDSLLRPHAMPADSRIIVVDDCSNQVVIPRGLLEANATNTWIRGPKRAGPHAAWNRGALEARPGGNIAIIGSDVVVPPHTLRLLEMCMNETGAGLVAASDWKQSPKTIPPPNIVPEPVPIPGLESCCVIRRDVWDRLGGFDEQFIVTFGDSDWNQRAEDAGIKRLKMPGVFVYHGCSVTRKRIGVDEDLRMDRADHARFLAKWASRPDVVAKHPMPPMTHARAAKEYFWKREGEQ